MSDSAASASVFVWNIFAKLDIFLHHAIFCKPVLQQYLWSYANFKKMLTRFDAETKGAIVTSYVDYMDFYCVPAVPVSVFKLSHLLYIFVYR